MMPQTRAMQATYHDQSQLIKQLNKAAYKPLGLAVAIALTSFVSINANAADGTVDELLIEGTLLAPARGNEADAHDVSADGAVVVGQSDSAAGRRAFRWTQIDGVGVMQNLGVLPPDDPNQPYTSSIAHGVNADGAVVVGQSSSVAAAITQAFRWTQAGGMVGLGYLAGGGAHSIARDVSADGAVVVGESDSAAGTQAFRWTQADGMVGLGILPLDPNNPNAQPHTSSVANAISADGAVIVGRSFFLNANGVEQTDSQEVFRWEGGVMARLPGVSLGANAYGVNADGTVVVGGLVRDRGAFRWTQGVNGAPDEYLPLPFVSGQGTLTYALGVNVDGSVIVGTGHNGQLRNVAFRWTEVGGMESVRDWLKTGGVPVRDTDELLKAHGVDDSGNTVVGTGFFPDVSTNTHEVFIARVDAERSGLVVRKDLDNSLMQAVAISRQSDSWHAMMMNSAHHRPLKDIAIHDGNNCAWVSGDVGRQWRQNKVDIGLAEIGACHDFTAQGITVGIGVGRGYSDLKMANNGRSDIDGQYGIAEVDWQIPNTQLLASLLGSYGRWDADLKRGYAVTGTAPSEGDTDITTYTLRARLDWTDAFNLGKISFSPRMAYTVYHSKTDSFQEQGGSAPAKFKSQSNTSEELRLGLTGQYAINQKLVLRGHAEAVHRFDRKAADLRGTANALGDIIVFNQDGEGISQDWVRLGAEADWRINDSNLVNVNAFVASAGEDADVTLGASWQMAF